MNKQTQVFVKSTGSVVEVVAKIGGWSTCLTMDGRQIKVRNGDIATREIEVADAQQNAQDEAAAKGKSVVAKHYRAKYIVDKDNTNASGRESVHNGDVVAAMLTGLSLEQLYMVAASLGISGDYAHLNNGMQRMNVGNRIRKLVKDGVVELTELTKAVTRAEKHGER